MVECIPKNMPKYYFAVFNGKNSKSILKKGRNIIQFNNKLYVMEQDDNETEYDEVKIGDYVVFVAPLFEATKYSESDFNRLFIRGKKIILSIIKI